MKYKINLLFIIFFLVSCSNNNSDKNKKIEKIFKKKTVTQLKNNKIKLTPALMKKYTSALKEFKISFQLSSKFNFIVRESLPKTNYSYTIQVLEQTKKNVYPVNFFIKYYTKSKDMNKFYETELKFIPKLENVTIEKQEELTIWNTKAKAVTYSLDDYYPLDKLPVIKIRKKVLLIFILYKDRLYELKYNALEQNFNSRKIYFDQFINYMEFGKTKDGRLKTE